MLAGLSNASRAGEALEISQGPSQEPGFSSLTSVSRDNCCEQDISYPNRNRAAQPDYVLDDDFTLVTE